MDNARLIWDKLCAAGLTPAGAAGVLSLFTSVAGLPEVEA